MCTFQVPAFLGWCSLSLWAYVLQRKILFYLDFWKEQNYVQQFNQQSFSFSFHEFLETRSFQEFKNPSFQESKFQTWIWTVPVFFQIIPVLRCIHQPCAFSHLSIHLCLHGGGGGFHTQILCNSHSTIFCGPGHPLISEGVFRREVAQLLYSASSLSSLLLL